MWLNIDISPCAVVQGKWFDFCAAVCQLQVYDLYHLHRHQLLNFLQATCDTSAVLLKLYKIVVMLYHVIYLGQHLLSTSGRCLKWVKVAPHGELFGQECCQR